MTATAAVTTVGASLAYSIDRISGEDGPLIALSGEIDASAAATLEAALREAAGDSESVVVDLDDASLIDSRTIGVLSKWTTLLRARGGALPIVCGNPKVRRLIQRIGMEQAFDLYDSRDAVRGG